MDICLYHGTTAGTRAAGQGLGAMACRQGLSPLAFTLKYHFQIVCPDFAPQLRSWHVDAAIRLDQSTRARLEAKLGKLLGQPLVTQVERLYSEFSANRVDPIPVVVVVVAETGRADAKAWMSVKE